MEFVKDELFQERTEKVSRVIIGACDNLDPKKDGYVEAMDAMSKLYKENINDMKAFNERLLEAEKIRVENERRSEESSLEAERLRIDDERNAETSRHNRVQEILMGVQLILTAVTAGMSGYALNQRFKRSTEKEENEAYLTQTDRITVQEGLREDRSNPRFWNLFK